jgi:hypothetical protein
VYPAERLYIGFSREGDSFLYGNIVGLKESDTRIIY